MLGRRQKEIHLQVVQNEMKNIRLNELNLQGVKSQGTRKM